MASKRGNNEGSIYKRKDGRWCAQVSLNGRRLTKYAKSQKECRDWVNQTLNKIDQGLTIGGAQISLAKYQGVERPHQVCTKSVKAMGGSCLRLKIARSCSSPKGDSGGDPSRAH